VLGTRMEDHLRIAVCYWHSFVWSGTDVFGDPTFVRPWQDPSLEPVAAAQRKLDVAFELFTKLGVPFFTFHDRDLAPEGGSFKESCANLDVLADAAAGKMADSGVKLLWGTANLFSHPRYAAGAASNPDPEVFAYAAAQVKHCLEVTHRLGGANYVMWGGREGYDTLLNTDLRREEEQLARFFHLVVDHARRIGFEGQILIEPKPQEPTKHQYDYDTATVAAFLGRYDLLDVIKVNLEGNHATLGGHSFHHEVAYATAHNLLGSLDANRGDPQVGWDTDQFPDSVEEMALVLYEVVRHGGLGAGGFNFDTKLRRQSVDPTDLVYAHVGGIDTLARSLLVAAALIEDGALATPLAERYAGWTGGLGASILSGEVDLADLHRVVADGGVDPTPRSGRQELLEGLVNRYVERSG
jgi:xylose isomerase